MTQTEVLEQAIMQTMPGRGRVDRFLEYFNELMDVYAVTRQTLYKWRKGLSRPDPRILKHALSVYAEDDPRHQFAKQLLEDHQGE